MVVEGVCLIAVLIGRLGRRGTGFVGILNEVPAAGGHEFGPRGVKHKIWESALSEPQGRGMGRAVGVGLWKLVGELSKELLAGALQAADTAHVWNLSPAEPL